MRRGFSLRSLLLVFAIAFTTVPVLLFGTFNIMGAINEGRTNAAEMNRRSAYIIKQGIRAIVDQYTALGQSMALEIDLKTLRARDEKRFVDLLKGYPKLVGDVVLNAKARSVSSYAAGPPIPIGVDYTDRPQIQQALATKRPAVSGTLQGRAIALPAVIIAIPLLDDGGGVAGYLSEAIRPKDLGEAFILGPEEYGVVIDSYGRVIVSDTGKTSVPSTDLQGVATQVADVPDGTRAIKLGSTDAEIQVLTIEPLHWKVVVGSGPEFVTAQSRHVLRQTTAVAFGCALAGIVVVSAVWLVSARGMSSVSDQLEKMSAAEPHPIEVPKGRILPAELGTLVEKFNQLLERTSKARLAEVEAICRVADYIFLTKPDGTISYLNESALRDFGDVSGRKFNDFAADAPISQEWKGDSLIQRPDGTTFDAFLSSTPILDDGVITSIAVIVQDITKEKAARESVAHSDRMITLGELVAGTSHELNNPLAVVLGYADLLLSDDGLDDEQRTQIQAIRKSALRASNVVHSMLAFARKRKPERVRTDINRVVQAAIDLKAYDLSTSGIALNAALATSLPPVYADPGQIQQVLLNIINNAQDAVMTTSINRVIAIQTEARGESVIVSVKDSGPGISRPDLKKVFNPFFTTKPVGKGTGLGLSISYGIVHEHHGDIRIVSEPGSGTEVIVELPVDRRPVEQPQVSLMEARPSGLRLLVVDDEPEIIQILSSAFLRAGFDVDSASTLPDAIAMASATLYDFVLTDVKMPGGSGIDLYRRLCGVDPKYRQRTIFLTGDTSNAATIEFFEKENLPYFSKPFDFTALDQFIRQQHTAISVSAPRRST